MLNKTLTVTQWAEKITPQGKAREIHALVIKHNRT